MKFRQKFNYWEDACEYSSSRNTNCREIFKPRNFDKTLTKVVQFDKDIVVLTADSRISEKID